MKINKIKMIALVILLTFVELFINNSTSIYVDLVGILLVIWITNDSYSLRSIIMLSLIADLIGHWYLGSHLLIILLLSFTITNFTRFYQICGFWQKNILLLIFYSIFSAGLLLVAWLTNQYTFYWLSYVFEIIIFIPMINYLFARVVDNSSDDLIFND